MASLDFPDLGLLAPSRTFSASPLQALALMNNPFVLHYAEQTAEQLIGESSDMQSQIRRLIRLTYQRDPDLNELDAMKQYVDQHGLAALCRIIFNSNEFLFIPDSFKKPAVLMDNLSNRRQMLLQSGGGFAAVALTHLLGQIYMLMNGVPLTPVR